MFCSKCGKEISEGAIFCTHCGSSIALTASAAPAPVFPGNAEPTESAASIPVESVSSVPAFAENPIQSAKMVSSEIPVSSFGASPTENLAQSINSAPVNNLAYSFDNSVNDMPESFEIPAPKIQAEERVYTFKHIAICLAAVAVMAIVAGVFAGLYFSAIV